jgi:ketosteroid isomerase-like protein
MSNIAVVQRLMDRILVEDVDRALSLLSEHVELMVLPSPSSSASAEIRRGRQAVGDYFGALGGIVTFWQLRFVVNGDQILVPGKERYVTQCGLESESDFVLACEVRGGYVSRIVVVEDVAATLGGTGALERAMRPTVYQEAPELEEALVSSLSEAVEEITRGVRVA